MINPLSGSNNAISPGTPTQNLGYGAVSVKYSSDTNGTNNTPIALQRIRFIPNSKGKHGLSRKQLWRECNTRQPVDTIFSALLPSLQRSDTIHSPSVYVNTLYVGVFLLSTFHYGFYLRCTSHINYIISVGRTSQIFDVDYVKHISIAFL